MMNTKKLNIKFIIMLLAVSFFMFSCSKNGNKEKQLTESLKSETVDAKPIEASPENESIVQKTEPKKKAEEIKVTFIELGSVKCIPCRMMQPIMEEIEKEYGNQVKVVFYDVWTKEGQPYAQKYRIRVIPTQVFLGKEGNEYYRHEGFFPKGELVKVLRMQGVE